MEDIIADFENLKISAVSKLKVINDETRYYCQAQQDVQTPEKQKSVKSERSKHEMKTSTESISRSDDLPVKKIIAEIEKGRHREVQEAITSRVRQISEYTKQLEYLRKEKWVKQQEYLVESMQQQEELILKALEQYDRESLDEHNKLIMYYQVIAEKQKKNVQTIQDKEKKKKMQNNILDDIRRDQSEFRAVYQEIILIMKSLMTQDDLKSCTNMIVPQLKALLEAMDEIIGNCKVGKVTKKESERSAQLVSSLKELKIQFESNIAQCKAEKELENQRLAVTQKAERSSESTTSFSESQSDVQIPPQLLEKYVSLSNFKIYTELKKFLENYRKNYNQLLNDNSLTQFKFDCKKAVNIPVNTISSDNIQHILDKYNKLHNLLSGKPITVGQTVFKASGHPQGVFYCTDMLAEKFVMQGDLMISSNPKAAFGYAAVIVALWNDFPDFGKLVLAHFYRVCPYLLPWFVPRSAGQTNEEYYKSQGYQFINGVVEKQDKFVKRMTGFMCLYFAIFITKPKRGHGPNPHGFAMAWRWCASLLNLEPRLDITATMLHVFLETVGFAMQAVYGRMFMKVVKFIRDKYLPLLVNDDSGGPVARLERLLQDYNTKQRFQPPNGVLPNNFW